MWRRSSIHSWPARRLLLSVFCLSLLILTTLTVTLDAQPSESDSLLRLQSIFEQQTNLLGEQSRQIDELKTEIANSENELQTSRQNWTQQIDDLNNILTQQQQALEESARSMRNSQVSQRKAGESWATYLETTERQIAEIQGERDKEATRARRRGIAFVVAVIAAGIEGAILIAQ